MTTDAFLTLPAEALLTFLSENPAVDLATYDFLGGESAGRLQWGALDRESALPAVRAYQRLARVGLPPALAETIIGAGLHSANHIARVPARRFIEQTAPPLGLSRDAAAALHRRATTVRNKTFHLWAVAASAVRSRAFRESRFSTLGAGIPQVFEDLPSYQELFGTLDFCICEDCRSIFGPAAYLVDLQRIIAEYVTTPNTATIPAGLSFPARRPDIGNLPLTCALTDTLVPYIQIVNERLLAFMQASLGLASTDAVLEAAATTIVYPRAFPFNQPLSQLSALLQQAGAPLPALLGAWGSSPAAVAAASAGFSPDQMAILTATANTADTVAPFFNQTASTLGQLADPDLFQAVTSLDFGGLLDLIQEDLSPAEIAAGLQVNFFINAGLGGQVVSLAQTGTPPVWRLQNLATAALDAINRQLRIGDRLGWTQGQVDWALRASANGATPQLAGNDAAVVALSAVATAASTLGLTFLQATALFGPIKTYGQSVTPTQFDALFNPPALAATAGAYHPSGNPLNPTYTDTPLSWTAGSTAAADVAAITRVLPGLGISATDANALGLALFGAAPQSLTVGVLSALYRHAVVSRALTIPISRYVRLLALLGQTPQDPFTAASLSALTATASWMTNTGIGVYQLDYIVNGTASLYVALPYRPGSVSAWQTALIAQAGAGDDDPATLVTQQIASLFGVQSSQLEPILSMAVKAVPAPEAGVTWPDAFLATDATGAPRFPAYVAAVLAWCSRWLVLQASLSLSDAVMANVAAVPAAYGLPADFHLLPLSSLQLIWNVQSIITTHGDTQNELLVYLDPPAGTDLPATLFSATGWPPAQTALLLSGPLSTVAPVTAQLVAMNAIFTLLSSTGMDVPLLSTLVSVATAPAAGNWPAYNAAANAVYAAVQSRYGTSWPTIAGTLTGTMAVAERDALLSWVFQTLRSMFIGITTLRNVFEFMLIDVQMGPETQISSIKEALNACQLYLQRCRLGLEIGVTELDIAPSWWEWLIDYRVWEANRQIFVYPENYLLPTLLTNSTPQYAELQGALQQSSVTDAYADEVFSSYVENFLTATQLTPVETYRATIADPLQGSVGCTFVFGQSNTDPVTYYWAQKIDNMPWTAWEKIDVAINAASISPVYAFGRLFVFWLETTAVAGSSIEVVGGSGSASTSNTTVKVSISYSFLNRQNKWVQPQTLRSEEVVFYSSTGAGDVALAGNPVFAGLFDLKSQSWRSPAVLHVTAANFSAPTATSEKICVFYGPILPDTVSPIDPGPPPTSGSGPAMAFYAGLKASVLDHNALVTAQIPGHQPLQPAIVIDALLDDSFVFHDAEVFALDAYAGPVALNQVNAQFSVASSSLLLSSSPTPVTDNLIADPNVEVVTQKTAPAVSTATFITPSIPSAVASSIFAALQTAGILVSSGGVFTVNATALATKDLRTALASLVSVGTFGFSQLMDVQQALYSSLPGTPLFSSIGPTGTAVAAVKNQPGWFVLDAGGEAFLLAPTQSVSAGTQPVFTPIDESAAIGPPLITQATFVSSVVSNGRTYAISPAQAATMMQIFQSQQLQIVSATGVYNQNATFHVVALSLGNMSLPAPQVQMIFNLLNGSPMVTPDVFTAIAGIDGPTSTLIYQALSSESLSIIDISGRVSPNNLIPGVIALAVGQLITDGKLTMFQVPSIYALLLTAVMPVAINYQNKGDASSFSQPSSFLYTVTRLTTAAVEKLERALFAGSIPALLGTPMQGYPVIPVLPFSRFGPNAANIVMPGALDGTQVDFDGFYGEYFWEIFFHAPRLVADLLQTNQQFSDAVQWLQYIFNPLTQPQPVTAAVIVAQTAAAGGNAINAATAKVVISQLESHSIGTPPAPILSAGAVNPQFSPTTDLSFLTTQQAGLTALQASFVQAVLLNDQLSAPSARFWQFFPFRNYTQETLTAMLSDAAAISIYNNDPFDPYAIARLRIGAFEKATVMQYIDVLIAWGDALFTSDTWETITAASLLYIYASDLLGPRPVAVGECPGAGVAATFNQIAAANPHGIPQFLIDLEGLVQGNGSPTPPILAHAFNDLDVYFCVPENATLMSYWDTIDDRLFKIENSQNISGQFRALALFAPPLDPLDLVKAAAAGLNVQSAIAPGAPVLPAYRFTSALAFAEQTVDTVIGFGGELLAALEKNDAEALSTLQTGQATQVLQMTITMKEQRVAELDRTLASLQASLASAQFRDSHYAGLIAENINPQEQTSLDSMAGALAANILAGVMTTAASIGYAVPQVGSPFAMTYGGQQLGNAINAAAGVFEIGGMVASYISSRSLTMAGYTRRMQDWQLQLQLAAYDVQQIQASIDACQQQIAQANQDLAVTRVQLAQSQAISTFLASKFTNQQLYGWMISQLSSIYFQAFQVAAAAAKAAEGAYQLETDSSTTFISFDYWNTLFKGLLAGEGVKGALGRMAASYRQLHTRRLQITKNISLGMLDPEQLLTLKATGHCTFSFPEELFDYDYPGQYARKIVSISVSIPAVLGPYQTVKAILTQTKNQVVTAPDISVVNFLLGINSTQPASGLRTNWANNQSVALSQALDDSGLFVLDFGDERYLPFENTGAVSTWELDMPLDTNRFDFAQLSDVILTLRYTALQDASLATAVRTSLASAPFQGGVYIDVLRSQPAPWFSFTTNPPSNATQTLSLTVPFAQSGYFKSFSVTAVWIRLDMPKGLTLPPGASFLTLTAGSQAPTTPAIDPTGMARIEGLSWPGTGLTGPWTMAFNVASPAIAPLLTNGRIDPAKLVDVELVVVYEATIF